MRLLPRRWVLPHTQAVMVGLLIVFWSLFKTEASWVSVAFYMWGVLPAVCSSASSGRSPTTSTTRARRSACSASSAAAPVSAGSSARELPALFAEALGTNNLLLVSRRVVGVCGVIVSLILDAREAGRH